MATPGEWRCLKCNTLNQPGRMHCGKCWPYSYPDLKVQQHAQPAPDIINHPLHYQGEVECIDAIESALTPEEFEGYCRANAMKYIWRAGKKGDKVTDLRKAMWYLNRLIGTKPPVQ